MVYDKLNKRKLKGQMSLAGFIIVFLMLVIAARFMPAIQDTINFALLYVDSSVGTIWRLVPLVLIAALIGTILIYAEPIRQRVFR